MLCFLLEVFYVLHGGDQCLSTNPVQGILLANRMQMIVTSMLDLHALLEVMVQFAASMPYLFHFLKKSLLLLKVLVLYCFMAINSNVKVCQGLGIMNCTMHYHRMLQENPGLIAKW